VARVPILDRRGVMVDQDIAVSFGANNYVRTH
jgi:hypothetical protein